LSLTEYDGVRYYGYQLRWDRATGKLQYADSLGEWQDTGVQQNLHTAQSLYYTLKLVVDTENHEYARALLNRDGVSLAGIAPQSDLIGIESHYRVRVWAYGSVTGISCTYVDDLIITQNEP